MMDERTGVAVVADAELDEIELIDDVDALEDVEVDVADDASTGAYARLAPNHQSPPRSSSPPPVPPEARQSRPPEAARPGSVPPPSRSRSSSGMFRIEHPSLPPPMPRSSVPPAPAGGSIAAHEGALLPIADGDELRETHAYAQRLRLIIRLREDRIRELEVALREQRERADRLAQELSQVTSQPVTDDLKRISGIGPGFERALHAAEITTFEQIAQWTDEDIERVAALIRTVPRRIVRDGWVERARELVAGRTA